MKDNPFFSVIIPTYNSKQFLEKSINSVLSQSFQDFEILVIDNSSVDGSEMFLNELDSVKVKVFYVKNNGVIAYSRNVGIKNASGKWLAFLDADDCWFKEKLEIIHRNIVLNPNVIFFAHDMVVSSGSRLSSNKNKISVLNNVQFKLLRYGNFFVTSSVVVNRIVALREGGFKEKREFITAEDCDFWMRLSKLGEFRYLSSELGQLTKHSDSASASSISLHVEATNNVRNEHLDMWVKENPSQKLKARAIKSWMMANTSNIFYKGKDYKNARRFALKSLVIYPFILRSWLILFLALVQISSNSIVIHCLKRVIQLPR